MATENGLRHRCAPLPIAAGPALLSAIVLRLLPAVFLFALFLRPFAYADLGWQLKLGELMLQEGTPFLREPFAASHLGEPTIPNGWLGQMIFALVQGWTGRVGLRAFDAFLWIGGIFFAALPSWRRSAAPTALALALLAGFVVALPAASIRPQSFAIFAFGLFLALIQSSKRPVANVLACGALLVFWQNLHPSVAIAAVILGLLAGLRWTLHFAGKAKRPWSLSVLTCLSGASVFMTPAGWHIVGFARYNEIASRYMGASEWLPLWHPLNSPFLWLVLGACALAAGVGWKARTRVLPEEVVPIVATLLMTVVAVRFLPFLAVALIPLLARSGLGSTLSGRSPMLAGASIVSAIAGSLLIILAPLRYEPGLPVAAVRELKKANPEGTIFCDPLLGGLVTEVGYPNWAVSFDDRYYRYGIEEWELFKRTSGGPIRLGEIEQAYAPAAFLLLKSRSGFLVGALRSDTDDWTLFYEDEHTAIFVPSGGDAR